jgi:protein-tyrosine phosphatase
MDRNFTRHIDIEFVGNLRDIGGYTTKNGRTVAWRKLYRSAQPTPRTGEDVAALRRRTGINTVLDLRGSDEAKRECIDLMVGHSIRYHNVPLLTDAAGPGYESETARFDQVNNLGDFYMVMIDNPSFTPKLIHALELIAEPANHPVLFHCAVGKDRTGILAAAVLSILGVSEEDIIDDYHMTDPNMPAFLENVKKSSPEGETFVNSFPDFMWHAARESMETVLQKVGEQYGSFRDYLTQRGCNTSLFTQLENALLDGNEQH